MSPMDTVAIVAGVCLLSVLYGVHLIIKAHRRALSGPLGWLLVIVGALGTMLAMSASFVYLLLTITGKI